MSPTKLQTLTTAATLAIFAGSILGSVSAAPLSQNKRDLADLSDVLEARDIDELVELLRRGPNMSKAAGNLAKNTADALIQNAGQGAVKKAMAKDTPLSDDQKAAVKKMTGPAPPHVVQAVVAGSSGKPPKKKRDLDDLFDVLEARDVDELVELLRRGPNMSKAAGNLAKNTADALIQNTAQGAVKKAMAKDTPLSDDQKAAIKKMTGPAPPHVVQAVIAGASGKPPAKKTRDLDDLDILEARDVDEFVELLRRGPNMSKAAGNLAKNTADALIQNAGQGAVKKAMAKDTPLSDDQKAAVKKMTGPAPPHVVQSVVAGSSGKPPKKKRDLDDILNVLEARDVDELVELLRRGPNMSKAAGNLAKNTADALIQNAGQGAVKKAMAKDTPLSDDQKAALKKVTGPAPPHVVQAVVAGSSGKPPKKKRDLDDLLDVLEARDVDELVELLRRGPNMSKAAGNLAKNTADALIQNAGQGAVKKAMAKDTPLSDDQKAALKKVTGPAPPHVVQAVVAGSSGKPPKKKRDLAALFDILEARSGLYGDLEDLD